MAAHEAAPSVGRIVHYVSYGTPGGEYSSVCRAAVVTEVTEHPDADGTAGLAVLNPEGMFFNRRVPHYEDVAIGSADHHPPGSWHWPERAGLPRVPTEAGESGEGSRFESGPPAST